MHEEIGYIQGVVDRMSTAQETFFQEYYIDQLQRRAREDQCGVFPPRRNSD